PCRRLRCRCCARATSCGAESLTDFRHADSRRPARLDRRRTRMRPTRSQRRWPPLRRPDRVAAIRGRAPGAAPPDGLLPARRAHARGSPRAVDEDPDARRVRAGRLSMDRLRITGGLPLRGEVPVSGAKNAALPILCAALLAADTLEIGNVPRLHDVATTLKLLGQMGARCERDGDRVSIDASPVVTPEARYELVRTMRASILVLGPLLARFGEARVALPGGCAIGQRPVDQHIKGLQAMGAQIAIEHGDVVARASRLKGARIVTDMVTVTGTENLMMAATLADGETVIENAAREPEVLDLAEALGAMGARIQGAGTDRIAIQGVDRLHGGAHRVMADRIETGTFLCAAAATGGDIVLTGVEPGTLDAS